MQKLGLLILALSALGAACGQTSNDGEPSLEGGRVGVSGASSGGASGAGASNGGASNGGASNGGAATGGNPGTTFNDTWRECGRISALDHDVVPTLFGDGESVVLWHPHGRREVRPLDRALPARELPESTWAVSAGGEWLASEEPGVAVWSLADVSLWRELSAEQTASCPLVSHFSTTGELLFTRGVERWCIFDVATGERELELSSDTDVLEFDGEEFVGSWLPKTKDATTRLVRYARDGTELARFVIDARPEAGGEFLERQVVLSPDGSLAASSVRGLFATNSTCALWSTHTGDMLWTLSGEPDEYEPSRDRPLFSPDGSHVHLCQIVLDTKTLETVGHFELSPELTLRSLAPSGRRAAVTIDRDIALPAVLDMGSPWPEVLSGHAVSTSRMTRLSLDADGSLLASHGGGEILVFRLDERFEQSRATYHGGAGPDRPSIELSPDGRWFSVSGEGRSLHSLERAARATLDPEPGTVSGEVCMPEARFSPDSRLVAGSGWNARLLAFRTDDVIAAATIPVPLFAAPLETCSPVAFTPDGEQLVTADLARFRVSDGRLLAAGRSAPSGEDARSRHPSSRVEVSPDGGSVVTSFCGYPAIEGLTQCETRWLTLDGQSSRALGKLAPFPSFSPDGEWLLAGKQLIHLGTSNQRALAADAVTATFAPNGDVFAGTSGFDLIRYCRERK